MESPGDVDGHVVDMVLHGTLAQCVEELRHLAAVGIGHLFGLQLQLTATFEVDEEVRARVIVEVDLVGEVVGMEDNDFVLVVPEV